MPRKPVRAASAIVSRALYSSLDRQHQVEELIYQNVEMPTVDLLKILQDRGLREAT